MAAPKIPSGVVSVFGLGTGGVNLVKDPILLDDNEVTLAQNVEPFTTAGRTGLRKRPALIPVVPTGSVTPTGAGGAILGGFTVDDPLGLPSPNSGVISATATTPPIMA